MSADVKAGGAKIVTLMTDLEGEVFLYADRSASFKYFLWNLHGNTP